MLRGDSLRCYDVSGSSLQFGAEGGTRTPDVCMAAYKAAAVATEPPRQNNLSFLNSKSNRGGRSINPIRLFYHKKVVS
jgi:hypothetical protein